MDDYTDEQMIRMLTNECRNAFRLVCKYIIKKLSAQTYHFVIGHGGQKIHVKDILNYALNQAYLCAENSSFRENTNVLGFVFKVAQRKFYAIIKDEKKLPLTNIDDLTEDLSDTLRVENELEELEERMKIVLEVLEQLKPKNKTFIIDAITSGMSMKDLAKKYNLKNAQIARNKKNKILNKIRNLLSKINNEDE